MRRFKIARILLEDGSLYYGGFDVERIYNVHYSPNGDCIFATDEEIEPDMTVLAELTKEQFMTEYEAFEELNNDFIEEQKRKQDEIEQLKDMVDTLAFEILKIKGLA